jgi:hypothetical protein
MSSTTESPTAARFGVGDSKEAETLLDQRLPISQPGELSGFSCAPCAERSGVTRIVVTGELDIATYPACGLLCPAPPAARCS